MKKTVVSVMVAGIISISLGAGAVQATNAWQVVDKANRSEAQKVRQQRSDIQREIVKNLQEKVSIGLSFHAAPTAGSFVKGDMDWTYIQDTISVGLFARIPVGDLADRLIVKSRAILGSSDPDMTEPTIAVVGTAVEVEAHLAEMISFNYKCQYYWGGKNTSPIYDMATGVSHSVTIDLDVPIFQF